MSNVDVREATSLWAILSSLVVDFDARQRSNLMTFFVVEQLPVPTPQTLAEHKIWLGTSARDWLCDRVLELSYTSVELASFARDMGSQLPPFRWLAERRVRLQCEIDAAALHLYRLTRSQAEWLLDSFTVLCKYEEHDHGEFRTKRVILEIYDALAEAIRTGQPYHTSLDPPPADPRVTHLAPGAKREPGDPYAFADLLTVDLCGQTALVQLPADEGDAEPKRFRFFNHNDPLPDKDRIVIVRHASLRVGETVRQIGVGKLQWAKQQDVATGEPVYVITLRGFGDTARLRLTEQEWSAFRPLAVMVD